VLVEPEITLSFAAGILLLGLLLAFLVIRWIMRQRAGTDRMTEIARSICVGAETYLERQYKTISVIAAIFAAIFAVAIRDPSNPYLGTETAGGFILSALCSNLAGYVCQIKCPNGRCGPRRL